MKVVGLISGGKDSTLNLVKCLAEGHEIVALANLHPPRVGGDELDSFTFQTVGHEVIELYAQACELPLFRREIRGTTRCDTLQYVETAADEVEDLYELLAEVKAKVPSVEAVSSGAILSDYQRTRVESVCSRLGLQSLAYLWRVDQQSLLNELIPFGLQAVLIKVAAFGLTPEFLGKVIDEELERRFKSLSQTCALNVCGEGGEYETLTLDCPVLFRAARIQLDESHIVQHSQSGDVAYLRVDKAHLEAKAREEHDDESKRRLELLRPSRSLIAELREMRIGEEVDPFSFELSGDNLELRGASQSVSAQTDAEKQRASEQHALFGADLLRDQPVSVLVDGDSFVCRAVGYSNAAQPDAASVLSTVFDRLVELVNVQLGSTALQNLTNVWLYVRDMRRFGELNAEYSRRFAHSPPVRVCVEASLPSDVELLLFATGVCDAGDSQSAQTDSEKRTRTRSKFERRAMHVQSVSSWAPANIGPYSQAVTLRCACVSERDESDTESDYDASENSPDAYRRVGAFAGQIGLQPTTMSLLRGDESDSLTLELRLAFRNLQRVIEANQFNITDVPLFVCYYSTDVDDSSVAFRSAVAFRLAGSPVRFVKVSRLPRGARFEWEACLTTLVEQQEPLASNGSSQSQTDAVLRVVEPRGSGSAFRWRIESRTFGERWIATANCFSTVTMLRTSGLVDLLVRGNSSSAQRDLSHEERDELDTVLERFRQQLFGLASVLKSNLVVRLFHAEAVSWMAYRLLERCAATELSTGESTRVFILPTPVVSIRRLFDERAPPVDTLLLSAILYSTF